MNDARALELLIKMKELGITQDDVKKFKEDFKAPEPMETAEEVLKKLFPQNEMTDDEIKYWHSPYYDELQAQKQLKEQQLRDQP